MAISRYYFESFPDGSFAFYSDLNLLFTFNRLTFRDSFETYAKDHSLSSNWVGSMLRLFHKACPAPVSSSPVRSDLERLIYKIGVHGIVEHLQDRGFRVTRPLNISEIDLIRYLEKEGYEVDGFIGDVHYSSKPLMTPVSVPLRSSDSRGQDMSIAFSGPEIVSDGLGCSVVDLVDDGIDKIEMSRCGCLEVKKNNGIDIYKKELSSSRCSGGIMTDSRGTLADAGGPPRRGQPPVL